MKYEIIFFTSEARNFGSQHTFQCEAGTMMAAFALLMEEWPEAVAVMAKEGWSDISGNKVMHGYRDKPKPLPVGPLEKRLQARK